MSDIKDKIIRKAKAGIPNYITGKGWMYEFDADDLPAIIALVREHDKSAYGAELQMMRNKALDEATEAIDDTAYSREIKDAMIKVIEALK